MSSAAALISMSTIMNCIFGKLRPHINTKKLEKKNPLAILNYKCVRVERRTFNENLYVRRTNTPTIPRKHGSQARSSRAGSTQSRTRGDSRGASLPRSRCNRADGFGNTRSSRAGGGTPRGGSPQIRPSQSEIRNRE